MIRLAFAAIQLFLLTACEPPAVIHGVVVEERGGAPIAGARVQFASAQSSSVPETTSSDDGSFELRVRDRARGDVVAAKDGYFSVGVGGLGLDDRRIRLEMRLRPSDVPDAGDYFALGVSLNFASGPRVQAKRNPAVPLEVGDLVLAIDGTSTAGLAPAAIAALMRGEDGTEAKLVVQRNGAELPVALRRTRLTGPPWKL
jgi:Carboxypeptidase regulatory-like domain